VLEKQGYLGGRVGGWTEHLEDGTPFEMERGFHAFFRQYYNLRCFLERIDPGLQNLLPLEDYPLLGPHGQSESFSGLPKTAPLNVVDLVRRTPRMGLFDMLKVNKPRALQMFAYDREKTYARYDDMTAKEYLDSLRFPPAARQMLFDVFAHSFFNPEERFSAADLLMMFHFYFIGNPEGLIFDVLEEPFSLSLWQPMERYLERLNVRVLTQRTATVIEKEPDEGFRVHLRGAPEPIEGDAVVLALDVPSLKKLLADSPDLQHAHSLRTSIESLDVTLPFAVWRLWMERAPRAERAPFAGTTGLGFLDNISIYERFEGESRRWALENGGSVVELHGYAVDEDADEDAIKRDLKKNFEEAYPEMRGVDIREDRFLLKRDCPSFAPGMTSLRPAVETEVDGLALAGDFVKLPFPSALMERAVASGFLAANQVMRRWGARPEPVYSIPLRGFLASFDLLS
jgi:isorenieratene synthase